MMKAMISQPMAKKTDDEIVETRSNALRILLSLGYEVINTWLTDYNHDYDVMKSRGVENIPLCFLADSLKKMSLCNAVFFCKGWKNARGCKCEHDVAKAYGLTILYEEDFS